jgi:hypothetical protein
MVQLMRLVGAAGRCGDHVWIKLVAGMDCANHGPSCAENSGRHGGSMPEFPVTSELLDSHLLMFQQDLLGF